MKIDALAWVSKGRPQLLRRSFADFSRRLREEKIDVSLCVSGTVDDLPPGLFSVDREHLCDRLTHEAGLLGVPGDIVRFALFGHPSLEGLGLVDTGSHRNALLLSFVGKTFLSIDDDVVCRLAPVGQDDIEPTYVKNNAGLVFDVFESKDASDRALSYADGSNILSVFLKSHGTMLGRSVGGHPGSVVAVTMSGIHGDSGAFSPRGLLLRPFADDAVYAGAIQNRQVLQYFSSPVATDTPRFMTMCAGFDNSLCLPPFPPVARNQDGVFVSVLRAVLPGALVGHVPWVVRHEPVPAREYAEGEARLWRFRIAEMFNLLIESFSQRGAAGYGPLAEFLEEFGAQSPERFLSSLRTLCVPRLDMYSSYLRRIVTLNPDASPLWKADVLALCSSIDEEKLKATFCVPEEFLASLALDRSIEEARSLVVAYGRLLKYWPSIRAACSSSGMMSSNDTPHP